MNNEQIVATLNNVANAIMNIEIKGKDAFTIVQIAEALNAIQNELQNRKDDE